MDCNGIRRTAWILFLLSLPVLLPVLSQAQVTPLPPPIYNIGIVTDGDTPHDRTLVARFTQEIKVLAQGDFIPRFPKPLVLSGGDSTEGVRTALRKLMGAHDVDLVLALGPIASRQAYLSGKLSKPVIAPFLSGSLARQKQLLPETGGPVVAISATPSFDQLLLTLKRVVDFSCLDVVMDRRDLEGIPEVSREARRLGNEFTMEVNLVPAWNSAEELIEALPQGKCAVMIGSMYHLDDQEKQRFIDALIQRRLPSFSYIDRTLVDMGVLATDAAADQIEKLARRAAVAVEDVLLGDKPASEVIPFARGSELTINMATARAIDIYPSLAVMTAATLLHEEQKSVKRRLTLLQAVQEALQVNLDLLSAQQEVEAGKHAVGEARSRLLPQVGAGTGLRAIDQDRAALGFGASPERTWTGYLTGSQQIYSESAWSGYQVEQHLQSGREQALEAVRLDIIHQAAVAYLNVLRAKTIEGLYKNNLKLTRANLERARIRMSTGVAGPDEVYRWETKYANDTISVLDQESATMDAMEALNRILNRPLQERFVAEEVDLSDPLLVMGDKLFFRLLSNPRSFSAFRHAALAEAKNNRPELKAIDAAIMALERQRRAARRAFWVPDVTVEGKVEQYFSYDGSGQRDAYEDGLDDTDWTLGVYARIPLYEGGRKSATLSRTQAELSRLRIDREAIEQRVFQDMLSALNRTRSSYPGISLSREAAEAARRNLKLITDSYTEGIKSIIELLDAQNQALAADQTAANAVYDFLIDFMGVQRAMGEFILFQPEERRKQWLQRVVTSSAK